MTKLNPDHIIETMQATDQSEINARLKLGWKFLGAMSDGKGGVITVLGKPAILEMAPVKLGAL